MARRSRSGRMRERQWNERVLGLITFAAVIATFLALSGGPDLADATRRVDYWTSGSAHGVALVAQLEAGAVVGLAGLLLLLVPATVIGASPLRGRRLGLAWLVAGVAMALVAGSGYTLLVREHGTVDLPGSALGVAVTVAEVALVALAGYWVGRAVRRPESHP